MLDREEYKGYNITSDGKFSMKVVHAKGSGALPKKLKGWFTNSEEARKAIDVYVKSKES